MGLYSFASISTLLWEGEVFDELSGCRGGFGGGGERLFNNLSDFDIDTDDEDKNKTVFKLEFRDNDAIWFAVDAGNVEEPLFVWRRLRRLETLINPNNIIHTDMKTKI